VKELKAHQEFATREQAALALEATGYTRDGGRWPKELWVKADGSGGLEWFLITWPTGMVTIEWPEQHE
jgi:hypothetical protein